MDPNFFFHFLNLWSVRSDVLLLSGSDEDNTRMKTIQRGQEDRPPLALRYQWEAERKTKRLGGIETHGWHLGIYGAPSDIDSAAGWVSHMNNTDVYPAGLGTRPTKEELRRQAWSCTSSSAPAWASNDFHRNKCILRLTTNHFSNSRLDHISWFGEVCKAWTATYIVSMLRFCG